MAYKTKSANILASMEVVTELLEKKINDLQEFVADLISLKFNELETNLESKLRKLVKDKSAVHKKKNIDKSEKHGCKECDNTFESWKILRDHVKDIHGENHK